MDEVETEAQFGRNSGGPGPQDLTLIPNDFPPVQDHFAMNFGEFNIRPPVGLGGLGIEGLGISTEWQASCEVANRVASVPTLRRQMFILLECRRLTLRPPFQPSSRG
jgi:hypothetical protein